MALSLLLLGCSPNKTEGKLKDAITASMLDPDSVQFRNTTIDPSFTYTSSDPDHLLWELNGKKGPEPQIKETSYKTELVCLEANGKNAYGGYAGFRKFCAYQYDDGSYSAYDVTKKEESEEAMRKLTAVGDELEKLAAIAKKRGYLTPTENAQGQELMYKFKQHQKEIFGKGLTDHMIFIPKDSK